MAVTKQTLGCQKEIASSENAVKCPFKVSFRAADLNTKLRKISDTGNLAPRWDHWI
jgi:hypothetical protein